MPDVKRGAKSTTGKGRRRRPEEVTVLVVDDEPDVRTYLASVLEDVGMRVLTAGDGEQALELLEHETPDLISLDLVMPRKSGIRVIHELRRRPAWARIPVVIVTGHAHDSELRSDLDQLLSGSVMSGPSMYLEKPVTPQRYLQHISEVLGVDLEPDGAADDRSVELRRQAERLLGQADAETLDEVMRALKRRGR